MKAPIYFLNLLALLFFNVLNNILDKRPGSGYVTDLFSRIWIIIE